MGSHAVLLLCWDVSYYKESILKIMGNIEKGLGEGGGLAIKASFLQLQIRVFYYPPSYTSYITLLT